MYQYRPGHPADLVWLDQAAAASAWETLSDEHRQRVHPGVLAHQAQMQLRQMVSMPGSAMILATLGGRPVGFLLLAVGPDSTTDEPTVHLVDLWVHPQHRRRRVAANLMRLSEEMAAAHGLQKFKIWTGLHNKGAIALAERQGYKPGGLIGVKDL